MTHVLLSDDDQQLAVGLCIFCCFLHHIALGVELLRNVWRRRERVNSDGAVTYSERQHVVALARLDKPRYSLT